MEIFNKLDTNNDGVLSKDELCLGYSEFYPDLNKEEISHLVDNIFKDTNCSNSGVISYNEFVMANLELKNNNYYSNLKQAFALFDKNGEGKINVKEIK